MDDINNKQNIGGPSIKPPEQAQTQPVQALPGIPAALALPDQPQQPVQVQQAQPIAAAVPFYQVPVRFRDRCKIINCFSTDANIKEENNCVVDTADGPQFGQAVKAAKLITDGKIDGFLKLLRIAAPEDVKHFYENIQKEKEAYKSCQQKIEEKSLEMKLVEADYSLDRTKIVFYFTAEKRMDFRELVKDLAYLLKARIEMRQIGVRDEAKMLGGYGCCGRELCCVSFLKDFIPVTIKMAKVQNLPLNQTKISGMCGRLMCCLAYEQGQYDSLRAAAADTIKKGTGIPAGESQNIEAAEFNKTLDKAAPAAPAVSQQKGQQRPNQPWNRTQGSNNHQGAGSEGRNKDGQRNNNSNRNRNNDRQNRRNQDNNRNNRDWQRQGGNRPNNNQQHNTPRNKTPAGGPGPDKSGAGK